VVDAQGKVTMVRLNDTPVANSAFADAKFKFGDSYQYFVRAVSLGSGGNPVESLDSNGLSVTPLDTFAPSQAGTPSVAPGPGRLAVFFPSNPEGDIAGYDLYRSNDPNLPVTRWTKLNEALLTKTTYQDSAVESGQKYYYYVIAVDEAGNRSEPSEVGSETVP
jgi:fibronectin type 3 domain-containing protein